ncbi:hypothetical protein DFS34DRAFT_651255 [Phlyctochytrium arcticum]|nr:hypothetical protein DFS34DRAFT_651255 [Phlyctochytrium arcticum]
MLIPKGKKKDVDRLFPQAQAAWRWSKQGFEDGAEGLLTTDSDDLWWCSGSTPLGLEAFPLIAITVPLIEERTSPNAHTAYQIVVRGPVKSWTVWHRYSDFDKLNAAFHLEGYTPPVPLPPKTFLKPAVEVRRKGLEAFLVGLLSDTKCRKTKLFLDFCQVPSQLVKQIEAGVDGPIISADATGAEWMDVFRSIQVDVQHLKSLSRPSPSDAQTQAEFRREMRIVERKVKDLEEAMPKVGAKEGVGEKRRREDLVSGLYGELERIRTGPPSSKSQTPSAASSLSSARSTNTSNADRNALLGQSSRKFGVAASSLTLDLPSDTSPQSLLQHQRIVMSSQDQALDTLGEIIRRQTQIGRQIGDELDLQNQLLGEVDEQVTNVQGRMKGTTKKLDRVLKG